MSGVLFRIMVPVVIMVKILSELELIKYVAAAFQPLMRLVGLPGEMGLVWATAVITNMYGGIVVFATIGPSLELSVAQTTVIACMILIAHSMPVETAIARKSGVRIRFMIPFRIVSALFMGLLLNWVFSTANLFQNGSRILWEASERNGDILDWAFSQARNLLTIFLIVLILIILMKVLDRLGITRLMNRLLKPVLTSMGISEEASTVTIIGMILGISYGGGLIIREAGSGRIDQRDVFFSIALMGLCHAVVEDTLLMMSLGATIWGVLFARILFSWITVAVLVRITSRIPDSAFCRFMFKCAD
ncbi:MAG: hypothetical protein GF388_07480 [Candidatus Aegiribacteria sp.]|nr:hypothetical protein [Candidatus Aegiribacteria sp.]MBD3294968.1 hypothetical protein [Candidatus Fermentibacteria bacterium]